MEKSNWDIRNQRLLAERSGLPELLGNFPTTGQKITSENKINKLLLNNSRTILPEYLTSVGRKTSIPSPYGLGYNLEK